jgi:transcriptional regulator with XRE-family HTH domain
MKTTQCAGCGGETTVSRKNYRIDQMGFPVELQRIQVIECPKCGPEPIIPHMDELMDTLALAVLCRPCMLTGAMVRFLRKYANKSAREFSELLHVDHTHLSKIENDHLDPGAPLDKLVRLTVIGLQPKLAKDIKQLMDLMPSIKDSCLGEEEEIQIDPATGVYQYA